MKNMNAVAWIQRGLVVTLVLAWSSQDLVESPPPRLVNGLEFFGAYASEMAVAPRSIIEGINVVGHILRCQLAILIDLLLNPLLLQAAEEGLRDRIIPAVALPTHARLEAIGPAEAPPRIASILRALI